jgi:hypothetical protein
MDLEHIPVMACSTIQWQSISIGNNLGIRYNETGDKTYDLESAQLSRVTAKMNCRICGHIATIPRGTSWASLLYILEEVYEVKIQN